MFPKEVAKLLIAYKVRLEGSKAQKPDFLVQRNDNATSREASDYWDRCIDEVKKMKEEKLSVGITLYDILISEDNKLASYERKGVLAEVLNYKGKFPVYENKIESQCKAGTQKLYALNVSEQVIRHFDDLNQKQGPFHLKIAEYLSNKDIKNLRKAAIQTMDVENSNEAIENLSNERGTKRRA